MIVEKCSVRKDKLTSLVDVILLQRRSQMINQPMETFVEASQVGELLLGLHDLQALCEFSWYVLNGLIAGRLAILKLCRIKSLIERGWRTLFFDVFQFILDVH